MDAREVALADHVVVVDDQRADAKPRELLDGRGAGAPGADYADPQACEESLAGCAERADVPVKQGRRRTGLVGRPQHAGSRAGDTQSRDRLSRQSVEPQAAAEPRLSPDSRND